MIWIFTCTTDGCNYKENPVRMSDPINPVMCGACFSHSNAVKTDEPTPEPDSFEK